MESTNYTVEEIKEVLEQVMAAAYPGKVDYPDRLALYAGACCLPEPYRTAAYEVGVSHRLRTTQKKESVIRREFNQYDLKKTSFSSFIGRVRNRAKEHGIILPVKALKLLSKLAEDHAPTKTPADKFQRALLLAISVYESDQMNKSPENEEFHRTHRDALNYHFQDAEMRCKGGRLTKPTNQLNLLANHPYVKRKGLSNCHESLQSTTAFATYGEIIVPFYSAWQLENRWRDHAGNPVEMSDQALALRNCCNYQTIKSNPDTPKLMAKGLKTSGLFHVIGSLEEFRDASIILVCEGWATGLSLYEASGIPVVCVGSCTNYLPVMAALDHAELFKRALIIGDAGDTHLSDIAMALVAGGLRIGYDFAYIHIPGDHNDDANDYHQREGVETLKQFINDAWDRFRVLNQPGGKEFIVSSRQYADTVKPPEWLIHYWILLNTLNVLIADPGSYKTYLALEMAVCLALGKDFHGQKVRQTNVLFVAGEGLVGLPMRQKALHRARNWGDLPENLYLTRGAVDLMQDEDCKRLAEFVMENEIGLMVIDTLNRNMIGNENSTEDLTRIIHNLTKHFIEAGCAVLLIHHSGHSEKGRGRGSSALPAGADSIFIIERIDESTVKVRCTKQKDAEPLPDVYFRRQLVETGLIDEQRQPVTNMVLDLCDAPAKQVSLKPAQAKLVDMLRKLEGSFTRKTAEQELYPHIKDSHKGRVLTRVLEKLQDSGELTQFGDSFVWKSKEVA